MDRESDRVLERGVRERERQKDEWRERGDREVTIKEGNSQNIRRRQMWTEGMKCYINGGVKGKLKEGEMEKKRGEVK